MFNRWYISQSTLHPLKEGAMVLFAKQEEAALYVVYFSDSTKKNYQSTSAMWLNFNQVLTFQVTELLDFNVHLVYTKLGKSRFKHHGAYK